MRIAICAGIVLATFVTLAFGASYEDGASQWRSPLSRYVVIVRVGG